MERAFILAALICVCGVLGIAEARWTVRPIRTTTAPTTAKTTTTTRRTTTTQKPITTTIINDDRTYPSAGRWTVRPIRTTTAPTTAKTTTKTTRRPTTTQKPITTTIINDDRTYPSAEMLKPRLIEQHDYRSVDGHYEYRYVLSNGDTRYERAYWTPVGKRKALARKGYYSYPLPNHKFLTVYYTADHNGYHLDSSTYSEKQPLLPRSIVVPEYSPPERGMPSVTTKRTTIKKRSPTKVPETKRANDKPNQIVDLGNVSEMADIQTTTTTIMSQNKDQVEEVVKVKAALSDKVEDNVVDIQAAVTQSTFGTVGTVTEAN